METPSKKSRNDDFNSPALRHTAKRPVATISSEKVQTTNIFSNLKEKTLTAPTNVLSASEQSKPKVKHITIVKSPNYRAMLNEIAGNGKKIPCEN